MAEVLEPQNDKVFMSASPEDRHQYLLDTDQTYASASPEDQKSYLQHVVTEGAKANIAQYPKYGESLPTEKGPGWLETASQFYQAQPGDSVPVRMLKGIGRAATGAVGMGQAIVSPATEEEKKAGYNDPMAYLGPLQLQRLVAGPREQALQHVHEMAEAQKARDIAAGKPNRMSTRVAELGGEALANVPMVGPYALESGERASKGDVAGVATEAATMGAVPAILHEAMPGGSLPGAPKVGESAFPTIRSAGRVAGELGKSGVRGAGHALEAATTPAVSGAGIGEFIGPKLGLSRTESGLAGGAAGGAIARAMGKSPYEPLLRVPRMTRFGLEEPVNAGAPLPENPAAALGRANTPVAEPEVKPQGQELGTTQKPPENPALKTLKSAYDKANSAYQKAYEAREAYRASMDQGVQPPAAVTKAFEKAQTALDEAQFHYETALDKGKPAAAPEPELLEQLKERKEGQVEQVELANKGGVMGKPRQLPSEVGDIGPSNEAQNIRSRMVPAKEAAGMYEEQGEIPKMSKTIDQVKKIGDLTREGLGGQELERNKPLREQVAVPGSTPVVEKVEGEVLPPEKEQLTQKQTAEESLAPFFEEEPKTIEGETEHPTPQVRANGENLANAIPKTAEGHALLQKLHDLTNVELRQLAINAGEDMGQKTIGRGKNSGSISRPEVFDRLLKNHSPEDLGRMVDEGKHLPEASGGSPATDIAEETKVKDLGPAGGEARARAALGPNASDAQVKSLMAEMQKEIYTGPERRATPRTAPLGAKELEEAIKGRKAVGVKTPFDVTEGAKATMERDKAMPKTVKLKAQAARMNR
jgi:hypothetical protein